MFPNNCKLVRAQQAAMFLFFTVLTVNLFGQKKNENFQIHIKKSATRMVIDGETNDPGWANAEIATNFFPAVIM